MAKIKSWFDCDLQKAVQVQALNGNVFSMDNNGNQICVRIFDGGEKAVISATVTARCILADGSTVNLNGSLTSVNSQSVAVVDIPQSVLLIPGTLKISVQLTASSVVATIAAIITTVYATKTDNVITPSSQVISDWNAEISSQLASAVKFSSQSLTDAQKAQARSNIGAVSTAEMNTALALKVNVSDIENDLTGTTAGKVLDARQGKVLDDKVSELKSAIDAVDRAETVVSFRNENYPLKESDFVQGTLGNNGAEVSSTTRIRSIFIPVSLFDRHVITVATGYAVRVHYYNENKTQISYQDFPASSKVYTKDIAYIRILVKNSGDTTITPSAYSNVKLTLISNLSRTLDGMDHAGEISVIPYTSGGYIQNNQTDGTEVSSFTPTSNSAFQYALIDVTGADYVCFNGTGWTTGRLWAFIDSSNKMISKSKENVAADNLCIPVPSNAVKLISNMYVSSAGISFKGEIVAHLKKRVTASNKQGFFTRQELDGNILYPQIVDIDRVDSTAGVTFTYNGDGSITLNGTSTSAGSMTIARIPVIEKGKMYDCHGCPSISVNSETCWMVITSFGYIDANGSIRKMSNQIDNAYVQIGFATGQTFNNVVFRPYFSEINFDSTIMNIRQLAASNIRRMFDNSTTISDINYKIAVTDGFDIDDDGNLYCGAVLGTGHKEAQPGTWTAHLIIANIDDIEGTKETILAFDNNEVCAALGNGALSGFQWCCAKKVSDTEVVVYCFCQSSGTGEFWQGYVAKVYNLTTRQFGTAQTMTIDVLGTTYPMYAHYISGSGIDPVSQAQFETIWEETGIEHHTWYGDQTRYLYYTQVNPVKYDGYWWASCCLGNMSHALCKTDDMLNWEYVCDIPLEQASEEVALCFYGDYLYATSRGNPTVDLQYSKIIRCPVNNLTAAGWGDPVSLNPCRGERPAIVGYNGYIYVLQCYENGNIDGLMIPRSQRFAYVFDPDLNLVNKVFIDFIYPILHPTYYKKGGNVFTVLSTDKRCYISDGGDGRSELSFAHLDMSLFMIGM